MTRQRIEWIDLAKGMGITLVSFGHLSSSQGYSIWLPSLGTVLDAIYSFHMPLFFFLGGLTFSPRGGFKSFLLRKTKTLLVPYYLFSVYFLLKPLILLLFPSLAGILHTHDSTHDAMAKLFDVMIMGSGLWFLMAFFVGEIIIYMLTALERRHSLPLPGGGIAYAGIALLILATFYENGTISSIPLPFQLIKGCEVAGYMAIGLSCRSRLFSVKQGAAPIPLIIAVTMFVLLNMPAFLHVIPASWAWATGIPRAFAGTITVVFLCITIGHNRLFSAIGRDSIVFYTVNTPAMTATKMLIFVVLGIDAASFPFIGQLGMGLLVTAVATAMMAAADWVVQRCLWWSIGKRDPRRINPSK